MSNIHKLRIFFLVFGTKLQEICFLLQVVLDNTPKEELQSNLLGKVEFKDEDISPIHWAVKKQCDNDLIILMRGKGGRHT